MKNIKIYIIIAELILIAVSGFALYNKPQPFGVAVTAIEPTDTIGNLRTRFNEAISYATSTLGALTRLSTSTGNLIVASSSANGGWMALSAGTNNYVLTASSTAPNGVAWQISAGGISSLNGSTSSTQTFATSSDTNVGLRIATVGGEHTFTSTWAGTLADSRIASADTWNADITTSSLSATAPISYNNVTGAFLLSITAVSSTRTLTAGTGLSGGGNLSADRTFTLNMLGGTCSGDDKISSLSATGTVICSTDQTGGGGGTATTTIPHHLVVASTTTNFASSTGFWDEIYYIAEATTTLRNILLSHDGNSPQITFNIYITTSSATQVPSSTVAKRVFTNDITFTNVTTTLYTPSGSSSVGYREVVRLYYYNASTTFFSFITNFAP